MFVRKIAIVCGLLLPLALGACGTVRVDLAYEPMAAPAPVRGAEDVTIHLEVGDAPTGDRIGAIYTRTGYRGVEFVANQSVVRMTYEAFQNEFRNRGFKTGPGPVRIKVRLASFTTNYRQGTVTADVNATASLRVIVLRPDAKDEYDDEYRGVYSGYKKGENHLMAIPGIAAGYLEDAFAEAVAQAMADKDLFAAILKVDAEARSTGIEAPVSTPSS
jgi:uncharacterized lipoprotein YajG